MLPIAYGTMALNFYANRRVFAPLQFFVERYTNFFGQILWRVFSYDVVHFYVEVYQVDGEKRENPSCANCEVSLACRRQDSGARLRVEAWLESARSAPPEDPGHACWLGHWNRGSKEHLRGGEA